MISITVNGSRCLIEPDAHLNEVLQTLGFKTAAVAVALNGEVISKNPMIILC